MTTNVTDKASILVVDDNPLIVNVLNGLFSSNEYQVYVAGDGEEALGVLKEKFIDVIVCDVMMPRMDGYRLHEAVRGKTEYAHIPFVFLTSLGDSSEINRGKETGADDYLVKPFNPQELLSVVRGKVMRSRTLRNLSDERYDSYRRKVIHTLSHEFRTPLVAINTGTELLIDQRTALDKDKIGNLLKAIQRGGQRLEHLVNDFMLLQQIEAGIAMRMFSGRSKLRSVSNFLHDLGETQGRRVEAEGFILQLIDRCGEAVIKIYEPQIENILERLISNAMKFSPNTRTVELYAATEADEVVIEVRDRGIGLDPEKMKEAIDVFGQIDRERLEQQGGGLGLAIASRYATIHGGRLDFERRPDGGSIVSLVLPRINTPPAGNRSGQ